MRHSQKELENVLARLVDKEQRVAAGLGKLGTLIEGAKGKVAWKKIHVRDERVTDQGRYFEHNDNIVVYGYVEVESPDDREVKAYVGSDDGVKVFVNGRLVHANPIDRGLKIDEDSFKVSLNKGRNAVLVKLLQGGGTWGFAFRLDDPKDELKYVLP